MDSGNCAVSKLDAIIIGGGAAGGAAAIILAGAGISAMILDSSPIPRSRPGEALHPGAEALFRQLGVAQEVVVAATARHAGVLLRSPEADTFHAFGSDESGIWRGYQIGRTELDAILLARATAAGAGVLRPLQAIGLQRTNLGWDVLTSSGTMSAPFIIDASGTSHWLARQLGLPVTRLSPRLVAKYGYLNHGDGKAEGCPIFTALPGRWTWEAWIKPGLLQWIGLALQEGVSLRAPLGIRLKGADVTWRVVQPCADSGYFIAGDAANVLDPACSHGVLRALMSGIYAGSLAALALREKISNDAAAAAYRGWLTEWVCRDALELIDRYAPMMTPGSWLQTAAATCWKLRSGMPEFQVTIPS